MDVVSGSSVNLWLSFMQKAFDDGVLEGSRKTLRRGIMQKSLELQRVQETLKLYKETET